MHFLNKFHLDFGLILGFFVCFVFSFLLGTSNLILAALIIIFVCFFFFLLKSGVKGLFLILIVGIPTVFVFANNLLQTVPILTVERLIFTCLILMSGLLLVFSKNKTIQLDSVEKAGLFFLLALCLSLVIGFAGKSFSTFISDDVSFFIEGYLFPIISYSFAKRINWEKKDISFFIKLLLGVGGVLGMTAVLQLFFHLEWFVPTYTDVIHAESRATGTFSNASEFGSVTAVLFILGFRQLLGSTNAIKSIFLTLIIISILIGVFLSKTRAPWLGLVISLVIIFIADIRSRKILLFFSSLILFSGGLLAPFFLTEQLIWGRLLDLVPIYNRLSVWATAFNMMLSNPVTGIGFGRYTFAEAKVEYLTSFGNISASWASELSVPHNEFVHILALTGITGLICYLYLVYQMIKKMKSAILDLHLSEKTRNFLVYVLAIFIGHLINGFLVDTGKFSYINILVYSLIGLSAYLVDNERKLYAN